MTVGRAIARFCVDDCNHGVLDLAFLGRLNPIGILLAGLLLALTYIGGESAQISMGLPSAVTSVFQGMLLFFILATDVLVNYRIRFTRRATMAASPGDATEQVS